MARALVYSIALVVLFGSGPSWASSERRDGRRGVFSSWVRSLWRGTHRSRPPVKPTQLDRSKPPVKPIHLGPPVEPTLLDQRVQDLGRAVAGSGSREKDKVALNEACQGLLKTINAQPGGSAKLDLPQRERIGEGTLRALKLAVENKLEVHDLRTVLETLMTPLAFSAELEATFAQPLRSLLTAAQNHKPKTEAETKDHLKYLAHLDVALRDVLTLSRGDKP